VSGVMVVGTRKVESMEGERKRLYIGNAFSVTMLQDFEDVAVVFRKITTNEARDIVEQAKQKSWEIISFVGHPSTAEVMSRLLSMEVPANRVSVKLREGDQMIVFSINTRLPEGRILSEEELEELVEQGKIQWWLVYVPVIQPII